ncbi:MAG: pilus assembly protein [Candidatus Dormibacteraeota bacterium]|nr:pilus assembly protein [Candidatus Dormibacteraeota bacterium]
MNIPRRARRRHSNAQAALETALVIPILLLLVCNFIALMLEISVQQQLDSAVTLAAESRFQATESSFDPPGTMCCPDARCCNGETGAQLQTGGIPTGCRYAAESFYGTMRSFGSLLTWHLQPLCTSGGDSRGAPSAPYPASPRGSEVSCDVGSVAPDGNAYPGYLDHALNPPSGLDVVICDATASLDFGDTPLAWGVFWTPTLHAHAEVLPPPFRQ